MKRIILTTIALFAISSIAFAQAPAKSAAQRKAARAEREVKAIDVMKSALASKSFVFYPSAYTLPFENPVELYNFGFYYFDFYPESVDIYLPFAINNSPAVQFGAAMVPYTGFKIVNTDGNNYVITARLSNVSNSMPIPSMAMQDMNLGVHIWVNVMSGAATLTLTPEFSPAVSYQGSIRPNN